MQMVPIDAVFKVHIWGKKVGPNEPQRTFTDGI